MQRESIVTDRTANLDQLRGEHARMERRLQELDRHLSLTAEEQRERIELKKMKLQLKDQLLHFSR